MKKRILCFGDSNTWGYCAQDGSRYAEDIRWTGVLAKLSGATVIEEGLNGRTTAFPDLIEPHRCGLDYLNPCLLSHLPIDFIIIMLGTNDTKTRFHVSAQEISYGMEELLFQVKDVMMRTNEQMEVMLISPILVKAVETGEFDETSMQKSEQLARYYQELCTLHHLHFLDAKQIVSEEGIGMDGIHLNELGHQQLAYAIDQKLKEIWG